jgi:hypothetical protein
LEIKFQDFGQDLGFEYRWRIKWSDLITSKWVFGQGDYLHNCTYHYPSYLSKRALNRIFFR